MACRTKATTFAVCFAQLVMVAFAHDGIEGIGTTTVMTPGMPTTPVKPITHCMDMGRAGNGTPLSLGNLPSQPMLIGFLVLLITFLGF